VIAVDTCVLARWLLRDDPDQAERADQLLAEPFYLGISVLVELAWVLTAVGGMDRTQMARVFAALLSLPTASVQHGAHVRWAIERFSTQGDLADLLHLCNSTDAGQFATFDRRLAAQAGTNPPVSVMVIA
jgi:predicted nucleic-acid-binding protein